MSSNELIVSTMETGSTIPQIFESVQGEGRNTGEPSTFVRLSECNLGCEWSPEKSMRVLMANWTWKKIGDVQVGDELLGMKDKSISGEHNTLTRTKVLSKSLSQVPDLLRLETKSGDSITVEPHDLFWLTGDKGRAHTGWRKVTDLKVGQGIRFLVRPQVKNEEQFELGYLSGQADGDGTYWDAGPNNKAGVDRNIQFRIAQVDGYLVARFYELCLKYNIPAKITLHKTKGFAGEAYYMPAVTCSGKKLDAIVRQESVSDDWKRGWLAGMFDSEGCFSAKNLRIAQNKQPHTKQYETICSYLSDLNFTPAREEKGVRVSGRLPEIYRFFSECTPWARKKLAKLNGSSIRGTAEVLSTTRYGGGEVVHIETDTSSFVCEGFLIHNCDAGFTFRFEGSWQADRPNDENIVFKREEEQMRMDVASVAENVLAREPERLIITGGEPLIQQTRVIDLINTVKAAKPDFQVEIETNGTIAPRPGLAAVVDQFNVSPKLANSGNEEWRRDRPKAMNALAELPQADFKFVITDEADLVEALGLVDKYNIPPQRVFLMPEGRSVEEIDSRKGLLENYCKQYGFNYSDRLQLRLYGDRRGT